MNPDSWMSPWEYQRLDEIHHQRMNALKDYYYNDYNFDEEANVKKYSEREMEMTELTDEIDHKEDEIRKLKQEIDDMKKDIKLIEKMKELLKQYALYSEIEYDEESLTLVL